MARRCEFLKRCPFLEPLTNKQISKLAGALEITYYKEGDYILRQGESGDTFYIIEDGTVKCTQVKSSGKEFELISLKAGDYFGG
jgi:CRP-like cAMP-binding protein